MRFLDTIRGQQENGEVHLAPHLLRTAGWSPGRLQVATRWGPGPPAIANAPRSIWWWTVGWSAAGVVLAAPEWVPTRWTREDGVVEYAGFACFLIGSVLAFVAAFRSRPARRRVVGAAALGVVLLFAAGEEISWGQRLFDIDTPQALVDGNRQDELNLHNVDGLQQKAVIAQLAVAGAGVWLACFGRQPWARSGLPFFAGYLAYRCGRAVSAVAGWGPAGRNAEVAEVVLALGLLAVALRLAMDRRGAPEQARRDSRPVARGAGTTSAWTTSRRSGS